MNSSKRKAGSYSTLQAALKRVKTAAAPRAAPYAKSRAGRNALTRPTNSTRGFLGAAGDAKFIDIAPATYAVDTTGTISHFSIVPQGTTVNSRDGKAFRPTSFECVGVVFNGTAASYNKVRCMLVWDYQPNKALASITDILDTASSFSLKKRENASRFKIIRDWKTELVGNNAVGAASETYAQSFDQYIKLPPDCIATCTATDTTGAIGNRVSGALLFVTIGNNAAGTSAATLNMTGRVNFADV